MSPHPERDKPLYIRVHTAGCKYGAGLGHKVFDSFAKLNSRSES